VSWDLIQPVLGSFQWHIVAVDAEGAPQPESKAMIVGK
jgi:hypothetical protein